MTPLMAGLVVLFFIIAFFTSGILLEAMMGKLGLKSSGKMNVTLAIVLVLSLAMVVLSDHGTLNPLFAYLTMFIMFGVATADTTRFKLLRQKYHPEEEPITSDIPEGATWPFLEDETKREEPTSAFTLAPGTWGGTVAILDAVVPETDEAKVPTKDEILADAQFTANADAYRLYPTLSFVGSSDYTKEQEREREKFIVDRTAVLVREHSIGESTPLDEWWYEWHQQYVGREKQEHEARENQKRIDDEYQRRVRAEEHRRNIDNRVEKEAEGFYPHLTIERRMMAWGWHEHSDLEEMCKFKEDRKAFLLSDKGREANIPAHEWFNSWRDEYYQERQRVADEKLRDQEIHGAYTKLKELGIELKPLDERRMKMTAPQPKPLEMYKR